MGDIRCLTSKCPNKTLKESTRNLKKSSTSSILPPKSTLLWFLFFEILRLVNIDISTLMKTILCLKSLICFVLKHT